MLNTRTLSITLASLCIGMGTALAATANTSVQSFSDVSASHPDADGIMYLKNEGVVQGYSDGTYKPDEEINRAEFTKITIESVYGKSEIDDLLARVRLSSMPDILSNAWYARAVNFARAKGIVNGYPDGKFRPGAAINFAETAKIMAETFGLDVTTGGDAWYEGYVRALANEHAIPTSIGTVSDDVTRGEMAEIMYRLDAGVTEKGSRTYEELMNLKKDDDVYSRNNGCVQAGCSMQLCVDVTETYTGQPSTCEWKDEYSCYQTATCDRQNDGKCGWTHTAKLERCLQGERAYPPSAPADPCAAVQCHINYHCKNGECILK